jgi:hypothetical protein
MASEARIKITTDTKAAEQGVTSVRGMFSNLAKDAKSSILTGVGLGAGVTAFAALGSAAGAASDFLADSIQAARDEEVGIRQLTTAIEANVAGWDGNIDAIERVIDEREKLGFADGQQRESLAVLTSVTKDHTKALDLQRIAMDLARLRGMDLGAASELIGKVYAGNVGILSRYGIQLAKGTSATEALAEIQKRAAGQAEAFADTAAGAAETLAIEFENLQEDIGKELLPVMVELAGVLRDDIVPAARDAVGWFAENGEVIGAVADAVIGLTNPLHNVTDELMDQAEMYTHATGAAAGFVENMGGVPQAVSEVGEAFAGVSDAGDELVEDMRELPGDIADALREGREDWQDALTQLSTDLEDETTRAARIAELQGALTGAALAEGLASSDPLVSAQAAATRDLILEQLAIEGVFQQGYNVGALWSKGLAGGVLSHLELVQAQLWQYKQLMVGKSPPPKGPLKDVDTGGFNIGAAWAEGIAKGAGTFQVPDLGLMGGAAGRTGSVAGGGGAAGNIHTHVYLDGRQIAEVIDRHHYYQSPGGASRLPR